MSGPLLRFQVLCIPGSNAFCERVFSLMNVQWTDDRSSLGEDTVESLVTIASNASISCQEARDEFKENKDLLRAVISGDKYKKTSR